ncbi:monovalent cation/H+ antiporter subunit D [Thiorhodovibrio frisius]|uniref:Formate hydrogenlyase subunit 3/multisubunit Na+/H+ antiporter, MnhD subunit n=1 Tax=Thiorhodovibrio frisius TaxID=631362 RepID=H8YX43_9GAMM|nr:monovalent cation/H+ antiporter subunit D [Thiorhodovibrio frisius]EIC23019.1 formate hydrogenlyase subunit 3/multisubunit Na+/H+ antiporter, MnhD subunit [Thiorhodovibrio frisius]WPL22716.1 Multiple resistance and pH homeostasis protein D [Thiorhodovibrio frisius]
MNHLLIAPVALPLTAGAALLILWRAPLRLQRALSLLASLGLVGIATALLWSASHQGIQVYLIGDWPAPYGISLVLDRLAALMLALTALLALFALAYAMTGGDRAGRHFHALFQFQLLGINIAFLTGDLFNLFVAFEILLIASYGLLLHGGGAERTRAALHYVALNLVGSLLFLIGLGTLYAATGSLNMADLASRIATLPAEDAKLARVAAMLLLSVFGLKAALIPLHFWLPGTYAAASAAVAALFAIMTKVGIYAIIRLTTLVYGSGETPMLEWTAPWLLVAGLATIAIGTLGAMASDDLRELIAYLVVVSVGTLVAGIALATPAGLSASLYYLVHSTLVTGGLFLLAERIANARDGSARLSDGKRPPPSHQLSWVFFLAAIAVVGMPPLSGLIGKVLLLKAAQNQSALIPLWTLVLLSSLLLVLTLTRAGILLFWRGPMASLTQPRPLPWLIATGLLGMSPLLVILGGPIVNWTEATAAQTLDAQAYVRAVEKSAPIVLRDSGDH